jgi:GT2 family glycosyltransferase
LVLVLNYNAGPALDACLKSLQATTYPNAHVLVLDNGSTDGSDGIPERLGVAVHRFGENLHYCGAYNRGVREFRADADFVLFSNPDIVAPPETIGRMVALTESDPSIGFVGPVQRRTDTHEVRSAGVRWRCGRLPEHVFVPGEPIDAVEGAFVLIRRDVFDSVGLLDESFAMNFEDVDFQLRARRHGFRSAIAADAEVLHEPPGTTRRLTGAYYQARNACVLTSRVCRRGALIRLQTRLYLEGIAGKILNRPRAPYILEGLRDFRRGVTGIKRFA